MQRGARSFVCFRLRVRIDAQVRMLALLVRDLLRVADGILPSSKHVSCARACARFFHECMCVRALAWHATTAACACPSAHARVRAFVFACVLSARLALCPVRSSVQGRATNLTHS
eukprot:1364724-Pleurochrysis_carterae.AAC.2